MKITVSIIGKNLVFSFTFSLSKPRHKYLCKNQQTDIPINTFSLFELVTDFLKNPHVSFVNIGSLEMVYSKYLQVHQLPANLVSLKEFPADDLWCGFPGSLALSTLAEKN